MTADASTAKSWPAQPVILEVNTWVWLHEVGRRHGRDVTLDTVPPAEWDTLVPAGVDALWLMGVWERSPVGAQIALTHPGVHEEMAAALPGMGDEDVVGSAYCIRRYSVDARLGGDAGLAAAREALRRRDARLIVDYVPNHVARDHPWTTQHPERFVTASGTVPPDGFVDVDGVAVALARDPYFPPWTDVVQLNAFSPDVRDAAAATLAHIATMADGVRCDMAMLQVNEVFAKTWGEHAGDPPAHEFWPPIIERLRAQHEHFLFVAEAYWDFEQTLLEQGFDYCYDKRFYERLTTADATGLRDHLHADPDWQRRLVRFAENHDEDRAAATLPRDALRAALLAVTTLPGAALLYEGQLEGRTVRPPVQLARRPDEAPDAGLADFGRRLLHFLARAGVRDGTWSLCDVRGWEDNDSARGLLAWRWSGPAGDVVVVINLSGTPAQGRVAVPWAHGRVVLDDPLRGDRFDRDGEALAAEGLYVELEAWQFHLLRATEESQASP